MKAVTKNISLTPELNAFIDARVESGLYESASEVVREGLRLLRHREELQQNFKSVLQAGLGKLDLVTREEFDVQRAVLLRTREKLEALEKLVAELEANLAGSHSPH